MDDDVIAGVRKKIATLGIPVAEAALRIGVTHQSFLRHLDGDYIRSDSEAKYRIWLSADDTAISAKDKRNKCKSDVSPLNNKREYEYGPTTLTDHVYKPEKKHYLVDLFCGCGGMSIGFDRFRKGDVFKTVLAMDIEEPMVRVFNDNHNVHPNAELNIGRQSNLTDFLNAPEIHGFYLDHLARTEIAPELTERLEKLPYMGMQKFRAHINYLDNQFLDSLDEIRQRDAYVDAYSKIASGTLGQTTVAGFHEALRLPATGKSRPKIGHLIWHDRDISESFDISPARIDKNAEARNKRHMNQAWSNEIKILEEKAQGKGKGQLSSSAKRIASFLEFVKSESMEDIRKSWARWRARRDSLRMSMFSHKATIVELEKIYKNDYSVDILLGGPPCQGFSRIGRGKLRSLREQDVHVQADNDSVDKRNQLMHQYVLFVAALAPRFFLFENVKHFKAIVKSGESSFDATEVLAEAIENVSQTGLGYDVSSRIVKALEHLIPQARERYFMAGTRKDTSLNNSNLDISKWILSLQPDLPINLESALIGLPEPHSALENKHRSFGVVTVDAELPHKSNQTSLAKYHRWILSNKKAHKTDGHIARKPRIDDANLFALFGPGKRWMDYRCDDSPTLSSLQQLLNSLEVLIHESPELENSLGFSQSEINEIKKSIDGSLSIRLLLETIDLPPGEIRHHLSSPNYLKKKEGQHGDWLARMDPTKPSKTMVSHMAKDTYAYIHPTRPRTISVREAARIQSFPDDYRLTSLGLVDGFRVIGNAVPPLLSAQFASKVAQVLSSIAPADIKITNGPSLQESLPLTPA